LDERYQWIEPVIDVIDRERTHGVGIENDHVIVSAPPWFKADPDTIDQIAYHLQAAAEIIRQRQRRRS
jgi:hypothetical protein